VQDWAGASVLHGGVISDHRVCVFQPTRLLSPSTVLRLQQGHCFEYSTVLASLLIGVGYDAYVVSGYATKEICLMDETRETCPMMKTAAEVIYCSVSLSLSLSLYVCLSLSLFLV